MPATSAKRENSTGTDLIGLAGPGLSIEPAPRISRSPFLDAARLGQIADRVAEVHRLLLQPPPRLPELGDLAAYSVDFCQRGALFWDALRQRGNQYLAHVAAGSPPVLIFDYELVVDGRKLRRPVNYALVRIVPPTGVAVSTAKRPYMIVDPRAGHGSGIGGFKDDSQVGVAVRAGHPVYFVIFFREPEPGQTLRDIAAAEALFLREIGQRHPEAEKPCVIGNCQGGWAVMALVAANPEIAGPVVVNGAPLSYWAGENGKNPMRYTGGMVGGSWPAQLLGDLGNGRFDGANLVMNFEELNPGNTYWRKYDHLFANIDTEAERFLQFERWWGGFYLMNAEEMRTIVDSLFVGNRLSRGRIPLDRSRNLDLRRIRSPIVVFCSEGDNITPPQQALNWIADVYTDEREIKAAGQTIVYLVHSSIGHLGIFVSGAVARREHSQIIGALEHIERLPPGLYEMLIADDPGGGAGGPRYVVDFAERRVADIVDPARESEDEKAFEIVKAISKFNGIGYDLFVSPWVRAISTEASAEWLRQLHPLRASRYAMSDRNPALWSVPMIAEAARAARRPAAPDNPCLWMERQASEMVGFAFDAWRDVRDGWMEATFHAVYGWLALLGLPGRVGQAPAELEDERGPADAVLTTISAGDYADGIIRMLLLLLRAQGSISRGGLEHVYDELQPIEPFRSLPADELRRKVRAQTVIVAYEPEQALASLPALLRTAADRRGALAAILASAPADPGESERVSAMRARFEDLLGDGAAVRLASATGHA